MALDASLMVPVDFGVNFEFRSRLDRRIDLESDWLAQWHIVHNRPSQLKLYLELPI